MADEPKDTDWQDKRAMEKREKDTLQAIVKCIGPKGMLDFARILCAIYDCCYMPAEDYFEVLGYDKDEKEKLKIEAPKFVELPNGELGFVEPEFGHFLGVLIPWDRYMKEYLKRPKAKAARRKNRTRKIGGLFDFIVKVFTGVEGSALTPSEIAARLTASDSGYQYKGDASNLPSRVVSVMRREPTLFRSVEGGRWEYLPRALLLAGEAPPKEVADATDEDSHPPKEA
jgi:hypothetical protein